MHFFYVERAISWILVLVVWHNAILIPDTNNDSILCSPYSGTTTSSSGQVSAIGLWVMLCHNELLVSHPDTSCRRIPLAFWYTHCTIKLYDFQVFRRTILKFLHVIVFIESWPIWRCDPTWAIETINSSMLANIGFEVLALLVRIRVLDSPNVGVPPVRHVYQYILFINYRFVWTFWFS